MTTSIQPKVLAIVEDDEDTCELVIAFFRTRNFNVKPFPSAGAFLKELSKDKVRPDVILTDLHLPEMDGIELVKKLRELNCETPVILLTAEKSAETAIRAIEAGAYDFVVKPMNFPQLQVSVERAIHFCGIKEENRNLKATISTQKSTNGIIGKSPGLLRAVDLARRVSSSTANVFISGETGSGKEVIAKAVHELGSRAKEPFIAINCSAIPENLLESELFGHAKGSFTGASDKKIGLFEEAGDGTLFLDEVGDLSLPLQAKLLRTLQERKIKRIGENEFRTFNARIITATHKNLKEEIREKNFREDLFFRLNVIPIHLAPLRERREDIIPLAEFFLKKFAGLNGKTVTGFEKPAVEFMLRALWPGNVRELENCIERAVVLCEKNTLSLEDLSFSETKFDEAAQDQKTAALVEAGTAAQSGATSPATARLNIPNTFSISVTNGLLTADDMLNQYISFALERHHGAKERTAKELGIDRKTIYRRLNDIESRSAATSASH
jgi:two-component system response regulator HydG